MDLVGEGIPKIAAEWLAKLFLLCTGWIWKFFHERRGSPDPKTPPIHVYVRTWGIDLASWCADIPAVLQGHKISLSIQHLDDEAVRPSSLEESIETVRKSGVFVVVFGEANNRQGGEAAQVALWTEWGTAKECEALKIALSPKRELPRRKGPINPA